MSGAKERAAEFVETLRGSGYFSDERSADEILASSAGVATEVDEGGLIHHFPWRLEPRDED